LTQDFIWGHYGDASPMIAEYNELLRNQGILYEDSLRHPVDGIRFDMDQPFLSPEFLGSAEAIFDQAETLAETGEARHRVERERLPIMYVRLEQGPELAGPDYGALIDGFETIARREGATYLKEGSLPNLDAKLQEWREMWNGYLYLPANPSPPDQATDVSPTIQLAWATREQPQSYNIYFGSTDPPEFNISQTGTTYDVGPLVPFTTWYWRVDSVCDAGVIVGDLWSFTTKKSPDFDSDGDVDQEDFGHFQACLTGSGTWVTEPVCWGANFDGDNDVDQNDCRIFRECLTGANVPLDPECAD
jgi:hypothetical protein